MAAKKGVKVPAAEPESTETDEVTKDQLLALGAEMNTLLFPGEEVDFTEMDEDGILEQIKADAGSIDPGDQFSDESKATLAAIGIDVEWTVPEAKETKPAKGKAAAKPKAEKKASEPKAKKEPVAKGPGVISTIVDLCRESGKKGISKDEILQSLKTTFPDRGEKAMKATISVQVPGRINKEKDFTLTKKEDGRYYIVTK